MRLAIVTTHPIQYYAPVFKLLAQRVDLMVFYTWGKASLSKHDPGFGKTIKWDIDLLDGYPYQWADNIATDPGTHHFNGVYDPDLIAKINAWAPDKILVYGWAYKSHLKILRNFKNKVPVIFRGDSTLLDDRAGAKGLLKLIWLRWVYRHADHAFYTGTNSKAYFQRYGFKEKQLSFVPHSVDNDRFAIERTTEVKGLKDKLGIDDNAIIILFAGKLEAKKDPALLLDAFNELDTTNVHLLIVGNGALKPLLQQRSDANDNVHFMDVQNQSYMPVVYQACDIFCLPSAGPGESWGLAVNEAMACSKAILVSDKVGCAVDLVDPGNNGYIFKAGSVTDLAEKLSLLIAKKKEDLAVMGQNSKNMIEHWDFQIQVDNIINYVSN